MSVATTAMDTDVIGFRLHSLIRTGSDSHLCRGTYTPVLCFPLPLSVCTLTHTGSNFPFTLPLPVAYTRPEQNSPLLCSALGTGFTG